MNRSTQLDEAERLQTLRGYGILDTPNEPEFDAIVRHAKAALRVPIVLMSMVDEKRQWIKARIGLDVVETPRCISFCTHSLRRSDVLVVPDASRDERFASNPLVTGPPFIRFYAGVPLKAPNGARVGTLCVIDTRPRDGFSACRIAMMEAFAAEIIRAMERRLTAAAPVAAAAMSSDGTPPTIVPAPPVRKPADGHTISPVADERHLRIELNGFWDDVMIRRYRSDLRSETAKMVQRGSYKGALVDASRYKVQSSAVARGHADAMTIARGVFGAKAAMVLPADNSRLQIMRLAEDTGHRAFLAREDALDWLLA